MSAKRILWYSSAVILGLGLCRMPALAQVPDNERTLVTDPIVLVAMGFPANTRNVYIANQRPQVDAPADFGRFDTFTNVSPRAFMPRHNLSSSSAPTYNGGQDGCCLLLSNLASDNIWIAPIDLPSGALLKEGRLYAADASTNEMTLDLYEVCQPEHGGISSYTLLASTSTFDFGYQAPVAAVSPNRIINNRLCTYFARAGLGMSNALTLQKVRLRWARQVTPAPGTATFSDVPVGSPLHRFVEALVAAGITAGCAGGNYCPDAPLTRGQMAVFLSVALGLWWP